MPHMDSTENTVATLKAQLKTASESLREAEQALAGLRLDGHADGEVDPPNPDALAAFSQAAQTSDQSSAVRQLIAGCQALAPNSTGTLSLREDEQTTVVIGAWDTTHTWVQGEYSAPAEGMGELAHQLKGLAPEQAQVMPLAAFGLKLGELRIWPDGDTLDSQGQALATSMCSLILGGQSLQRRLQHRTVRDALTGLFNRRYLEDTLNREIHRSQRNNTHIGLILLELDEFAPFREEYGPAVGDRMIQAVGGLLLSSFRGSDVCCRFDGERFAVILPDASVTNTERRAEGMVVAMSHVRITQKGAALSGLTASAGVAGFPKHAESMEDLIAAAESALYLARDAGGNRAVTAEKVE